MFKKGSPLLGIDISSTAVKLLELSEKGGRYRVESYAVEPLPPNAVTERTINDVGAVGNAIKRAWTRSGTKIRQAAVAVAGSAVITKVIALPAGLTDEELFAQIELEADRYIPFSIEEVNLDFVVLGPSEKNPQLVDVLLAASKSDNVDSRLEALEAAGLKAKVVDVEAYALELAFSLIAPHLPQQGKGTVAVVDIGATMTILNVLRDGRSIYTRELVFGGRQLTEAIQQRYGLSFEEAGKAKKAGGLPASYQTEVLEPFMETLAQQVNRLLQFFFSSSRYTKVDHIVLAGGCANIPGIAEWVQSRLQTPTTIANPFADMMIAPRVPVRPLRDDAPAMMIACGLAMRSFVTERRINLLPWREELRRERQRRFLMAALGTVILTGGAFYGVHQYVEGMIEVQQARNDFLRQEIVKVDKRIKEVRDLEEKKQRLLARMEVIHTLQSIRPLVVHLFEEIAKAVPEGVYLTHAQRKGNELTLEGMAESYARVSTLMHNFEASPWCSTPHLNIVETREEGQIRISRFVLKVGVIVPKSKEAS